MCFQLESFERVTLCGWRVLGTFMADILTFFQPQEEKRNVNLGRTTFSSVLVRPQTTAFQAYVLLMCSPTQHCLLHSVCLLRHDLHVKHQQLTVVASL